MYAYSLSKGLKMASKIQVEIDVDTLVETFVNRAEQWIKDKAILDAYEQMYKENAESELYEGIDFSELGVMQIVDNDCVNWISVVEKKDASAEDWKALQKLGRGDLDDASSSLDSLDCGNTGFLEVITNKVALIRQ